MIQKSHKVTRFIGWNLQWIDERKLSLAIANSGFMYQDIAPSNCWKINGIAGPTGDFFSEYLEMLFLIISSVCRHVDGVFSKKICIYVNTNNICHDTK